MFNSIDRNDQNRIRDKFKAEHQTLMDEFKVDPTPIGSYVLIKMLEPEDISNGGIIIPTDDRDQAAMRVGLVLKFGPTALAGYELPDKKSTRGPNDYGVNIGDFVEYERHSGKMVSYQQFKGYRILSDQDIYMVYKEQS